MSDNIDDILDNDPLANDSDESAGDQNDEPPDTNDQSTGTDVPERSVPSGVSAPADDELGHVLASEEIHVSRQDYQVNAFIRRVPEKTFDSGTMSKSRTRTTAVKCSP